MMADDIIDPDRSLRHAIDSLRNAVDAQTKHLESFKKGMMQEYFTAQKEASEAGVTSSVPGAEKILRTSQTTASGSRQEAGEPGLSRSEPPDAEEATPSERRRFYQGRQSARTRRHQLGAEAGRPDGSPIPGLGGMADADVKRIREEPLTVPEYQWKLDEQLRVARDLAIKGAGYAYEGKIPQGMAEPLGGTANFLNKAYGMAAPIEGAMNRMKGGFNRAWGSMEVGEQLGYSPQSGPIGSHVLGFRNPLAPFTSEAGQQGLGQKAGALEAMFSGGISMKDAVALRSALSAEGIGNKLQTGPGGSLLGLYNAGENEAMAELLEPAVKEYGIKPEVAAGRVNMVRYGQGTVDELSRSIKGLGDSARIANVTTEKFWKSQEQYAKDMESEGARWGQSMINYKQMSDAFGGLPPEIMAGVNRTPIGTAFAAAQGVLPGTVGAQNKLLQAQNAVQTIKFAAAHVRGTTTKTFNHFTNEWEETDPTDAKVAEMERIYQVDPKAARAYFKNPYGFEHAPEITLGLAGQERKWHLAEEAAKKHGGQLTPQMHAEQRTKWGSFWNDAHKAGVSEKEFHEAFAKDKGGVASLHKLYEDVRAKNAFVTGGEQKGQGIIELSSDAKKWFELKYPNEYKQAKEEAQRGGKSTAQRAGGTSTGRDAKGESLGSTVGNVAGDVAKGALQWAEHKIPIVGDLF